MKTQEELKAQWEKQLANSQYAPKNNNPLRPQYDPTAVARSALPHTEERGPGFNAITFAKNVGSTSVNVAGNISLAAAKFVGHTATTLVKDAVTGADSLTIGSWRQHASIKNLSDKQAVLSAKQDALIKEYKAGNISAEDYSKSLIDLSNSMTALNKGYDDIIADADPMGRAISVANTAATILTFGELSVASSAVRGTEETALDGLFRAGSRKLEGLLTEGNLGKVLNVNSILERNLSRQAARDAQKLAGESALAWGARESRHIAAQLLIKRPLVYEWNIGNASEIYTDMIKGDYSDAIKSAGWAGLQALEGGPIGASFKLGKWTKGKVVRTFLDQAAVLDKVSSKIGNHNPDQIRKFLETARKKLIPEQFAKVDEFFRIFVATNLKIARGKASTAVSNILNGYAGHSLDDLTPATIYKDAKNWIEANEFLHISQDKIKVALIRAGKSTKDVSRYVVVRWDTATKKGLAEALSEIGSKAIKKGENVFTAISNGYSELSVRQGATWSNNRVLTKRLEAIIDKAAREARTDEEMIKQIAKEIKSIGTASVLAEGIPKDVGKYMADRGYTVAVPAGNRITPTIAGKDAAKLVFKNVSSADSVFDKATSARPGTKWLVSLINKAGLSPESSNKVAMMKLSEQVALELSGTELGKSLSVKLPGNQGFIDGGKSIINKLRNYIDNKAPSRLGRKLSLGRARASATQDIRQLTVSEYSKALDITEAEAKIIKSKIIDGYLKVPVEIRGLGDSIVDILYKVNPLYATYSKAQSALRYTYNPFFTVLERFETSSLSRMEAGRLVWGKTRTQLDEAANKLKNSRILSGGLAGQGATDNILGRITAQIDAAQERNLAGLALNMAKKKGITLDQMLSKYPNELEDALRIIVQYPVEGVLSSSLARTLNLVFFPVRYNAKVTLMAAKVLMKQPPTIQFATISSLFRLGDWLQSPEGVQWRSDNSETIQILGWLTPVGSVTSTLKLLSGNIETPSDLGLLGGLPLGVITQTLDSLGYININAPYVNPKTGDVIPDYIPISARAKAATALQDLLGSMFTYPGRTIGLPGKSAAIGDVVNDFIKTNGKDFDKRIDMDKLTSTQKNFIKVLKGDMSQETLSKIYEEPDANGNMWPSIPSIDLPIDNSLPQSLPKVPKTPKGRKGRKPKTRPQPIPARGSKLK